MSAIGVPGALFLVMLPVYWLLIRAVFRLSKPKSNGKLGDRETSQRRRR